MRFYFGETRSTFFLLSNLYKDDNIIIPLRLDYFTYLLHTTIGMKIINEWKMCNFFVCFLKQNSELFVWTNWFYHRAQSSIIIIFIKFQLRKYVIHMHTVSVLIRNYLTFWKSRLFYHRKTRKRQWMGVWLTYVCICYCRTNKVNIYSNLLCKLCTNKFINETNQNF